jgi:type I restriction enzyme S subunit
MREMKDSGIEWIGEIPVNWDDIKCKYAITIRSGEFIDKSEYTENGKYSIIGSNGEIGKTNKYNNIESVITTGRVGTIGTVHIIDKAWVTDNAFIVKIINSNICNKFVYYCIPLFDYTMLLSGTAQPLITATKIRNQSIPFPSIKEQQTISACLDKKCSEIDSLTADIQKQIETLEEYKRSVITEAVTKGLNPDAEMKDSGVQWVGEMPTHWKKHPIYYYFSERKNKNSLGTETNLLSLSYGKIIRKDINSNGGLLPEGFNTYNIIEINDIIIRPTDLQNDKRSLRTGISREHGIITSAYIAMKVRKNVNPRYFHYLLHAYDVMKVFYNMGNGVRQGLNFSEFSRLMVLEPPLDEQQQIADYLDQKCTQIDGIISDKKKQLETLEEYKKSLIFEYVTGKKEVY